MLAELASHVQPLLLLVLFSKSPMVVMTANQALVQLASTRPAAAGAGEPNRARR